MKPGKLWRVGLYTILVVVSGYALLPWWLPKNTIKDWLVEQVERDLGRAVSIEGLTISWAGGVEITGLAVARRDGPGYLLKVDRLTAPFSPMALVQGRVGPLTAESGAAYLIRDADGRWNISDLHQWQSDVALGSIDLQRMRVHIVTSVAGAAEDSAGAASRPAGEIVVELVGRVGQAPGGGRIDWGLQGQICDGAAATIMSRGWVEAPGNTDENSGPAAWAKLSVDNLDLAGVAPMTASCSARLVVTADRSGIFTADGWVELALRRPGIQQSTGGGLVADAQPVIVRVKADDLEVSAERLLVPGLTVQAGTSSALVRADLCGTILPWQRQNDGVEPSVSSIDIDAEQIDVDELNEIFSAARGGRGHLTGGGTSLGELADKLGQYLPALRRWRLAGSLDVDRLKCTDPQNGAQINLQQLRSECELDHGQADITMAGTLNGGVVRTQVQADFNEQNPRITCRQVAERLAADAFLSPMVESEFPGLEVSGTFSEKTELASRLDCLVQSDCHWTGTGTTVCTEGVLWGPGGPGWMLKVFPGLRLVEYRWVKMTNDYERRVDGSKKNHLIFNGKHYDIYMEGVTRPVVEPDEYAAALEMLARDRQVSQAKLAALAQKPAELQEESGQRVQRQAAGLAQLWQRHQAGERLRISAANYVVGGLLSIGGVELFARPKEILRVPLFRSHSYIVGRFMVGIKTENVVASPIGR